ncbi:MAG: 1-acyl-sn-glycerol-3-phosphate acyltransferase [Clostridia bacterium]|nr:1-acyl-sn-glycerol-3-phosphate acyltransferase [Clostridia bacterium]
MYYRHDLNYTYPEKSDEHMITVKHLRDTHFDENYDYIGKGFLGALRRATFFLAFNLIACPLCTIRHGLKIYGRENLKKYKKELKNGAITISNHVLMWDYMCVLKAIRPHMPYFPGWKTNFEGPNGPLIRWASGIPVPTDNFRAMAKFKRAIEEVLEKGKWLHFFPEGSMWFYYPDIRPLKKAVFQFAVKYDKPVIPISISFRPRRGIERLFGKKPLADLHIGEPLFVNKELDRVSACEDIRLRAYIKMQEMNGIKKGDPTYNEDLSIENYKSTM